MRFEGEIKEDAPAGYKVEVSLREIPSMAQAREIGAWLHDAVESYLASKGARLLIPSNVNKQSSIIKPN